MTNSLRICFWITNGLCCSPWSTQQRFQIKRPRCVWCEIIIQAKNCLCGKCMNKIHHLNCKICVQVQFVFLNLRCRFKTAWSNFFPENFCADFVYEPSEIGRRNKVQLFGDFFMPLIIDNSLCLCSADPGQPARDGPIAAAARPGRL